MVEKRRKSIGLHQPAHMRTKVVQLGAGRRREPGLPQAVHQEPLTKPAVDERYQELDLRGCRADSNGDSNSSHQRQASATGDSV